MNLVSVLDAIVCFDRVGLARGSSPVCRVNFPLVTHLSTLGINIFHGETKTQPGMKGGGGTVASDKRLSHGGWSRVSVFH
jgi:hypothetical protein